MAKWHGSFFSGGKKSLPKFVYYNWVCKFSVGILILGILSFFLVKGISYAGDTETTAKDVNVAVQKLTLALTNKGQASPEVVNALHELSQSVRQLTEALTRQEVQFTQVAQKVNPSPEKEGAREVLDSFMENFKASGDFRLRYENDSDRDSRPSRNRNRLRFRLGTEYKLHDDLTVGGRVRTGDPDDPNSPHQTLGEDVLDSFELELEQLYLTYKPSLFKGLWLKAGKFSHPFKEPPVYGEVVWDADVRPEGFASGYTIENLGPLKPLLDSVELYGGIYVLDESNVGNDVHLPVGQIVLNKALGNFKLSGALGYYSYQLRDKSGATILDNDGNVVRGGDFTSNYQIFDTFLGVTYGGFRWPITLMGQYFENTEAEIPGENEGIGYALGLEVGRSRDQGDWRLFYQYSRVEQESVFTPFTQDDFLLATNYRGNVFGVGYMILPKLELRLWTSIVERIKTFPGRTTDSDDGQIRFRADLNARF